MNFEYANIEFAPGLKPKSIIEIGVNHNGDMGIARQLVDRAKKSGADIVKFQAFVAEEEISRYADKADYQKETTGSEGGQLEMAKQLELSPSQLKEMRTYCYESQVPFLCSVFDYVSLDFLVGDMGLKTLKIPSSEVTNHPFLAETAKRGVDMILSTGASDLDEVAAAVKAIREAGDVDLVLLHCVSNYPATLSELNLSAMHSLAKEFKVPVGFSDHSEGYMVPVIAAAMGAVAIEKHFTLDKNMKGPDHRASIDPVELDKMVEGMNLAYITRGDGLKKAVPCEAKNQPLIRKSIVANRDLKEGHILSHNDLGYKRPYNGLHPYEVDKVLGKALKRDMQQDEPIKLEDLIL